MLTRLFSISAYPSEEANDAMRLEVRHGKNSPQMVVVLEGAGNYDPEKHEWIPTTDEVGLVSETLNLSKSAQAETNHGKHMTIIETEIVSPSS